MCKLRQRNVLMKIHTFLDFLSLPAHLHSKDIIIQDNPDVTETVFRYLLKNVVVCRDTSTLSELGGGVLLIDDLYKLTLILTPNTN